MATKADKVQRAQELLSIEGATTEAVAEQLVTEYDVKEATALGYIEEAREDTPGPTKKNNKPQAWTKEGYEVAEGEENDVHVIQCLEGFDPLTGKRLHKPFLQKYNTRGAWNDFLTFGKKLGHEVIEYLHVPAGAKKPEKLS